MKYYSEINYEKNMKMLSLASKYCNESLSHDELINELYNDNDLKKQLCLIEIEKINSQNEADILTYNLTGKSGPIRETASFAILKLIKKEEFNCFFQKREIIDTFVKAITDINPSVSRNTIEIIKYVEDIDYLYKCIIEQINLTLSKISDIKQNRSYTANKKNFNLYWNLEAVISISDKIAPDVELITILNNTALSNDYTIREKTAKAAMIFSEKNIKFKLVSNIMKNDDNIYVRKYL